MDADELQAAVRRNTAKSVLLVAGFPFVLPTIISILALIWLVIFGQREAFGIAARLFAVASMAMLVVTIVWLPIGYLANQWIIDRATKAQLLGRHQEPQLWVMFETLCAKCGMRLPALRLIDTPVMNAYASGLREGSYSVTVTRGLIDALSTDEIEAVLAHELTHIRNRDVRLLMVATVLVGMIPMLHDLLTKVFWALVMGALGIYRAVFAVLPVPFARLLAELGYGALFWAGKLLAYIVGLVGTISALVIHFALSRRREFMADAGAVEITGKPEALIAALRKISGNSTLDTAIDGVRAMLFDNALFGFGGLFATHPPIDQRIEAILRLAASPRPRPNASPSLDRPPQLPQQAPMSPANQRLPATGFVRIEPELSPPAPEPALRSEPPIAVPVADPETVARYRRLLLQAHPERLDLDRREQLYRRVREAIEQGKQLRPTAVSEFAAAELCFDEAVRQIEAALPRRKMAGPISWPPITLGHG